MSDKLFGKILLDLGIVTVDQVQEALARQRKSGQKIGEELIEMGAIEPIHRARALAEQFNLDVISLKGKNIAQNIIDLVPRDLADEHELIPFDLKSGILYIACANPLGLDVIDNLRFKLGLEVEIYLADKVEIEESVKQNYGVSEETLIDTLGEDGSGEIEFGDQEEEDSSVDENDSQIIKLVHQLIANAVSQRASDIHIEPVERRVRIRYRVDGSCHEVDMKIPKRLQGPLISRIKIMSRLDIAEKRKPQDGQINFKMPGKMIDLRVSTLPARFGESTVLRILDKDSLKGSIEELGFSSTNFDRFSATISRPNGVFLVTGPTGSGKTTTLYGALKHLNRSDVKIITAEDPVEYHLSGINQCQVNHQIGFNFARILRAMLRQAPNVILVGEIRDKETADIAIESALTGHFVFSTVHTNDAPSTMTRLIDIGVEPFQVASAVSAVLAQRLVKTICPHCKEEHMPSDVIFKMCDLDPEVNRQITWYRGVGCDECKGSGYLGRMAIHELMLVNREVMELIFANQPASHIRRAALLGGMASLREDAIEKAKLGHTTLDEVVKGTHSDRDLLEGVS